MTKKIFLTKSAGFFAIVFLISLAIESYLDNSNFPQFNELKSSLENKTKIIYFGDSTMRWAGINDTDKRPIGIMLQDIRNSPVTVISSNAYHLGVYEQFSSYICNSQNKPEVVIFPINLRSFSPEWDTRPQYQFDDQIRQIRTSNNPISNLRERFFRVFGGKQEGQNEILWKNQIVYYNTTPVGKVIDFNFKMTERDTDIEQKIRKKFIYQYLYNLNSTHRKLASLNKTINNYKNCGVKPIIYITPIDYQNGAKYLGQSFTEIVDNNIQVILSVGKENLMQINDLSFSLDSKYFTYYLNPSEHLDQYGRKFIAENISKEAENLLNMV